MPIHVVFKELNAPHPPVHHAETLFILEILVDTENVYDMHTVVYFNFEYYHHFLQQSITSLHDKCLDFESFHII